MTVRQPNPVAARSKGWVCYRSLAGIVGSNPTKGLDVSLVSVVCCQVDVPATGRSLVQRNPTVFVCVSLSAIRCANNPIHLK
jgi:hypothetical protein